MLIDDGHLLRSFPEYSPSIISSSQFTDTTLVDDLASEENLSIFNCEVDKEVELNTTTNTHSFFIAGSGAGAKVKAAVSALARSHGRHEDCPGCKAKRLATQEAQEKLEKVKLARQVVKNARPYWR